MIPVAFDYRRPASLEEAIGLLSEHGDEAKLLAGGHSLLPLMKLRLATPAVLVDIGRLQEMSYIRADGEAIAIGALTRHRDLEVSEVLAAEVPLLAHVAALVGDPQVRHRGTIGGSLAHGDPAADLAVALLALDAVMVICGSGGHRRAVPATEFFRSFLETAVGADEVLVEVRVPRRAGDGWAYEKFSRRGNDWATVAVAVVAGATTAVGLANMGATVLRARGVEAALASGAGIAMAAGHADEDTEPGRDVYAGPEYRRHLARLLTRRALTRAHAGREV